MRVFSRIWEASNLLVEILELTFALFIITRWLSMEKFISFLFPHLSENEKTTRGGFSKG